MPASLLAPLPTRVVDVGPQDGSKPPKLFLTQGGLGEWICLSHCWGSQWHFVLDSGTMKEMLAAISPNSIPPKFRDAITTTRKLGYRYLWIDSLCIIQDSYDDWVSESNRMQSYYKDSVLTIAASDADGDEQGFLGTPRKSNDPLVAIPANETAGGRIQALDPEV